jgi:oxalate decarboxylase
MVQIADSRNFLANKDVAAALVTLAPGGLRELHWHPNADKWNYWSKAGQRSEWSIRPERSAQV